MKKIFASAIAVVALLSSASFTSAQEIDVQRIYGEGVHAYFNGKFEEAVKYLDKSIEAGSTDARAFYFRGLAQHQLGNKEAGNKDFIEGSKLERKFANQQRVINRSLQRIQGDIRLSLEKTRRGIHSDNPKTVEINKTRIEVKAPTDTPNPKTPKTSDSPKPNLPDSSKIDDPTAPFPGLKTNPKTGDAPKTTKPDMKPVDPPKVDPKGDGIFGDSKPADKKPVAKQPVLNPPTDAKKPPVKDQPKVDSKPAEVMPPKQEDLFGDSKADAKKPTDPPKATPKEEPNKQDDIFGDTKKADPPKKMEKEQEDLFGDSKPADKKPADKKPADSKKKSDTEDLFGDSKPADKKPADKKPADKKPADSKPADSKKKADTEDLFGDSKPADKNRLIRNLLTKNLPIRKRNQMVQRICLETPKQIVPKSKRQKNRHPRKKMLMTSLVTAKS